MTQDATSEGLRFSGVGIVGGTSEYQQQQDVVVIGAILWLAGIQYLCFPPTHLEEGSERHRQVDRPPDPRVLFSPSRAPCYKSDATLTPVGTVMNN